MNTIPKRIIVAAQAKRASVGMNTDAAGKRYYWWRDPYGNVVIRRTVPGMLALLRQVPTFSADVQP